MRYILNDEGYIDEISFGATIECKNQTCTEYTGTIPTGYVSLEAWAIGEDGKLNAWKIVEGNLVFDNARYSKLQVLYEQETYNNAYASKKEMGMTSTEEINPYADLFPSHQSAGGYITYLDEEFNKVGNLPTEEVNLTLHEEQDLDLIELEFIGNNFLPNTATSTTNNGITYTQNKDKTISIKGTATDRSTLNLAGTDTSVRNILTFKKGIMLINTETSEEYLEPYYYNLTGLVEGVSLEFYHYDGTDRTLIGAYNKGLINYDVDVNITQVVLVVESGTTIDTTIKPMLSLVSIEHPILPMEKYKGNLFDNINPSLKDSGVTWNPTTNGGVITTTGTWLKLGVQLELDTTKSYTFSYGARNSTDLYVYIRTYIDNAYTTEKTRIVHDGTNLNYTFIPDSPYVRIYFSNSAKVADIEIPYIQLEEGIEATEYKEYNGRNDQYYVDGISTQNTSKRGINYCPDIDEWTLVNGAYIENGYIVLPNSGSQAISPYIPLDKQQYFWYAYANIYTDTENNKLLCNTTYFDSNKTVLKENGNAVTIANTSTDNNYNWTFGGDKTTDYGQALYNAKYLRIIFTYNSTYSTGSYKFKNPMISSESQSSFIPYIPNSPSPDYPSEIVNIYKAGIYNVVLDNKVFAVPIDEDLRSLPNGTADRLWVDVSDEYTAFEIERKVGEVVFDGTQQLVGLSLHNGATYLTCNYSNTIIKRTESNNVISTLSDKLLSANTNQTWNGTVLNSVSQAPNGTYLQLCLPQTVGTTISEVNDWLSIDNTTVYYELATYTTTTISEYSYDEYAYEEFKNNFTLIDLKGNTFTCDDKITIKDNQILLIKNGAIDKIFDEDGNELPVERTEIYLGDTVMPRTYTPNTHAYCHQRVYIDFKYKDPRNVDINKINLKGLILITNIETEYNFTSNDYTKVRNYMMGTENLTDEEIELYDINGDGIVTSADYIIIKNMVDGAIPNKITGTLEINSTQSKRTIVLRDSEGKIKTSLGLNGIATPSLSVNGVLVEENIKASETATTTMIGGKRVYKKLYTGTMGSTTGESYALLNLDIDYTDAWIDQSLSYIYNDNESLPPNFYNSSSDYLRTWINKTASTIRAKHGANLSSYSYNIVVAYTKD